MVLFKKQIEKVATVWDLDDVVYQFNAVDAQGIVGQYPFRIRDSVEGIVGFGDPGGGKSSAIIRELLLAYLKAGYGGILTTIKPEDTKHLKDLIEETGRGNDLVIFSDESNLVFDPLLYELERQSKGGGKLENLVKLIDRLDALVNKGGTGVEDAGFWLNAKYRCTTNACYLLKLSGEKINIENIKELILSASESNHVIEKYLDLQSFILDASTTPEEAEGAIREILELMDRNYLINCVELSDSYIKAQGQFSKEYIKAKGYFFRQFKNMGERTKSSVLESLMGQVDRLESGLLDQHFNGKVSDELRPEKTYSEGKIILLDFPISLYDDVGKLAQGYYRMSWMNEMLRRKTDLSPEHRPVFMYIDEFHMSLFSEFEHKFQSLSRSARVATLAMTQNLNAIYVAMGSKNPESKAKNLLGNYTTTIFASNMDADTNEYASKKILKDRKLKVSSNRTDKTKSETSTYEYVPQVWPIEFTRLKRGGKQNGYICEAYVTKAGKVIDWKGSNFLKASFEQKKPNNK